MYSDREGSAADASDWEDKASRRGRALVATHMAPVLGYLLEGLVCEVCFILRFIPHFIPLFHTLVPHLVSYLFLTSPVSYPSFGTHPYIYISLTYAVA